ncbi:ribonuclease H-like domain-containing protein [Lipomyces japonicus]|uniref:ribonuclease H-like domain-containing protein n=1 Tax=Lipomyces japonicus TaxID=56871 RepID=UPI0034CDFC11
MPPPPLASPALHQAATTLQQQQVQASQLSHQQVHGLQAGLQTGLASPQISNQLTGSFIREVWRTNFEQEMRVLRELVERYNYLSMDTEFPGIVARPIGSFKTTSDYHYQTLRCNVDLLNPVQLGITFADEHGNHPEGLPSTWQFNLRFSLSEEMYSAETIDILQKSGVDFKKHEEYGIDPTAFAELLISSGLVLEESVRWISFHSGYDYGYLVSLMINTALPAEEEEFLSLVKIFFPYLYDVKYMARTGTTTKGLKGNGLSELAEELRIARIGPNHQAGCEALLTSTCFFELRKYMSDSSDANYM